MVCCDRDGLVNLIKASGQEIINRAEDIVGEGNYISDINIWIRFPADGMPTIEVQREHVIRNQFNIWPE